MHRFLSSVIVVFPLVCLGVPCNLHAQDVALYVNRGNVWQTKGKYDKAIEAYDEAIRINPKVPQEFSNRGLAWRFKGEYDKAIADCSAALRLKPNYLSAYVNRGVSYSDKGDYDKAIADFTEVIRLRPTFGMGYFNRGNAWKNKGEYDKAIADYNKSIEVDPDDPRAYNILAWFQATCPDKQFRDGEKAIRNATRAYDLDNGQHWNLIDTLAAANAEIGDFNKAREWLAKAVELAGKDELTTEKDRQKLSSRQELFKQNKPYREELKRKQ